MSRTKIRGALAISIATMMAAAVALAAPGWADGGTLPSNAPMVKLNTTYYGDNTHCDQTNCHKDFWRLPALLNRDRVQIAWQDDTGSGVDLCLTGNVDNYSWSQHLCNISNQDFQDFGEGQRDTFLVTHSATSAYLETNNNNDYGPYHFVIEKIRHQIGLNIAAPSRIHRATHLRASARLTNGSAVPSGYTFKLTMTWPGHKVIRTAKSTKGRIVFAIALPRSAVGHRVAFQASRSRTNTDVAAVSPRFTKVVAR